MAQAYQILSIVAFSLAGVFFLLSVFFWFRFGIWKIINDLSGRSAKKSIAAMREQNEKSGRKTYHSSPVLQEQQGVLNEMASTNQPIDESVQEDTERTMILSEDTEILGTTEPLTNRAAVKSEFHMIEDIVWIHTDETI